MKQKKRQQGFTLIELMAVVAILAVLATIAIPGVVDAVHRGRAGTNQANQALLQSAIMRHWTHTGAWPATLHELRDEGYVDRIPHVAGIPTAPHPYGWHLTMAEGTIRAVSIPAGAPGTP